MAHSRNADGLGARLLPDIFNKIRKGNNELMTGRIKRGYPPRLGGEEGRYIKLYARCRSFVVPYRTQVSIPLPLYIPKQKKTPFHDCLLSLLILILRCASPPSSTCPSSSLRSPLELPHFPEAPPVTQWSKVRPTPFFFVLSF